MSRSGYTEDSDEDVLAHGRWRGAVKSAINGKRGQAFLRELLSLLDEMDDKVLVKGELESEDGCFCTLGVIGRGRGLDLGAMDIDDYDAIAASLGVNAKVAQEIMWENDESISEWKYVDVEICGPMRNRYCDDYGCWHHNEKHRRSVRVQKLDAGHRRWCYMRAWVESNLTKSKGSKQGSGEPGGGGAGA